MTDAHNRVEVLHGVNFDMLGSRDADDLRRLHARRAGGAGSSASPVSWTWRRPSSRPTPRASSSSTCTGCPSSPTPRSSTPAPGPTTAGRSATRSTSPGCPRSRSTSPTSSRARSGAGISVFDGLVLAQGLRQGPGRLPRGARADRRRARASAMMHGARGAPRRAGRRARARQLFVTDLVNVRYLTGFAGTNGACLVGRDERIFFTDFRYTERAEAEVEGWEVVTVADDWLGGIAERLAGQGRLRGRPSCPCAPLARLEEKPPRGRRAGRRRGRGRAAARGSRTPRSSSAIAAAAELADEVWRWSARARPRRPHRARGRRAPPRRGSASSAPSPPSRRSSPPAPNGALPHAEPGEREIGAGELVVFDMGAKLDGYCSDGTRTFATGEPGERGARGLRARARARRRPRSTRSRAGRRPARRSTRSPAR